MTSLMMTMLLSVENRPEDRPLWDDQAGEHGGRSDSGGRVYIFDWESKKLTLFGQIPYLRCTTACFRIKPRCSIAFYLIRRILIDKVQLRLIMTC